MPATDFATPEARTQPGKARSGRAGAQSYKGYVLTPHAYLGEQDQTVWSVGVFIRTHNQPVEQSRYFRFRGVQARTRERALKQALQLGKRLVDEDLLPYVQRHIPQTSSKAYRRIPGQVWHFCRTCAFWPVAQYEASSRAPRQDQLCNECLARASTGAC